MKARNGDLDRLRSVNCAALLERLAPPWRLDKAQSTRRCLKYRRGAGEIILVTHEGRGWWDPGSATARGDVFNLVQHLQPGASFTEVCRTLREVIGIAPSYPAYERTRTPQKPALPVEERWARRSPMRRGSLAWAYLTDARRLPPFIVAAAIAREQVREGPHASAWFAHRDHLGRLTGFEIRGPDYRGFSAGGQKSLFRIQGAAIGSRSIANRLAVTEAPIDALSLGALECLRADTLYLGTAGGMGPHTLRALEQLLQALSGRPDASVVTAFDADKQGERYAGNLAEMAARVGVASERLLPPEGWKDWNQVLTRRAEG